MAEDNARDMKNLHDLRRGIEALRMTERIVPIMRLVPIIEARELLEKEAEHIEAVWN